MNAPDTQAVAMEAAEQQQDTRDMEEQLVDILKRIDTANHAAVLTLSSALGLSSHFNNRRQHEMD